MNNLSEQNKSYYQNLKEIAAFGCSWTDWHTIGRYENQPNKSWPEYLGEYLNCNIFNGGRGQLNNNLIAQNVMMYLAKGNRPDAIVVQLSEWERVTIRDKAQIDNFKLGDIASGRRGEGQWFRYKIDNYKFVLDKQSLPYQESGLATMIYIQILCESHNIPVCFLNYQPLGDAVESPIGVYIKPENMIIENYRKGGWQNHLAWCGFKGVDECHYGTEAQEYTAEAIAGFLTNPGTHVVVEEVSWNKVHNHPFGIFDYT